jgi:hypothetical protein
MKVKCKGVANRCLSCMSPANIRIWYATIPEKGPIEYIKVAYFCSTIHAARRLAEPGIISGGSRAALMVKLTTHILYTYHEN